MLRWGPETVQVIPTVQGSSPCPIFFELLKLDKKMNHYAALKVAIASIEAILSNQTLSKDVRIEFESNKENLINLLRFL